MRIVSCILALAWMLATTACGGSSDATRTSDAHTPVVGATSPAAASGNYIVELKETVSGSTEASLRGNLTHRPKHVYAHALKGFAGSLTSGEVTALRANPNVKSVQPDGIVKALAGGGKKPPLADFTAAPRSGVSPLVVQFSNTSQRGETYLWEFGDATTSRVKSPAHTYTVGGSYTVKLTATNSGGSHTKTWVNCVTVTTALVANFTATPSSGQLPLTVQFTDTSIGGPIGWSWDCDWDGWTDSFQQNPTFTYYLPGTYSVMLRISRGTVQDSEFKQAYITVTAPPPPAETLGWGVDRVDADLNTGNGGAGITVAVLDTGIDYDHPDLEDAVVGGVDFTSDPDGYDDGNGHGTHVSGVIASRDNDTFFVGVAPQANLVAVKVLDDYGSGSWSDVIAGIDWVVANKATYNIRVANMSLGSIGSVPALETAINNAAAAGIVIVVAAGNSGEDVTASQAIPAMYEQVICVSALESDDTFAYFSNWGAAVDITAPGVYVPSLSRNGWWEYMDGTSMATPHVAGAIALLLDDNPEGDGDPSDDFQQMYDALQAAAESGVWFGDPDGNYEKLVDCENL